MLASNEKAKLSQDEKIVHVLNRLGYGLRPGDVERVRKIGLENYIEQQLNPSKIDDTALMQKLKNFETLKMTSQELARAYPLPQVVKALDESSEEEKEKIRRKSAKLGIENLNREDIKGSAKDILIQLSQEQVLRAVYSERQLYEVMADFWTNHFNIFWAKGLDRYLMPSYIHGVIRNNAMGDFPSLLKATAESPAMLFYLDNWQSVDPEAAEKIKTRLQGVKMLQDRSANNRRAKFGNLENKQKSRRTKEALERLKSRKFGLNENYARELMELHTLGVDGGYTQKDVTEVARCFTGWTFKREGSEAVFFFNDRLHDKREKIVLGVRIPAGGGKEDAEKVLDILANHPSTAKFIATKLVRRFVADNPPSRLVDRVAASYTSTKGDITSMLRTIFTSAEFFSRDSYQAKIKNPLTLVASALRAIDAETNAGLQIIGYLNKMGQPLFLCQAPTGYADTADKWLSSTTLVERLNFAVSLCEGRIIGTVPKLIKNSSSSRIDSLAETVLHRSLSQTTREAIEAEIGAGDITTTKLSKAFGLLIGSPEFQRM